MSIKLLTAKALYKLGFHKTTVDFAIKVAATSLSDTDCMDANAFLEWQSLYPLCEGCHWPIYPNDSHDECVVKLLDDDAIIEAIKRAFATSHEADAWTYYYHFNEWQDNDQRYRVEDKLTESGFFHKCNFCSDLSLKTTVHVECAVCVQEAAERERLEENDDDTGCGHGYGCDCLYEETEDPLEGDIDRDGGGPSPTYWETHGSMVDGYGWKPFPIIPGESYDWP